MKTSILVTAYNYGRFVERCIRSCLNQRLVDPGTVEVLLIDDCSTDDTRDRVAKFANHPGFRYLRNDENLGVAGSANRGILEATGQFVVRVDADDFVSELFAFYLSSYLQANPAALGVCCDYLLFNDQEEKLDRRSAAEHPISCGILYRRDPLLAAGGYNAAFRHREEEELRRRIGPDYRILHFQMPLYRYRMHDSNKTKSPEYESYRSKVDAVPPGSVRIPEPSTTGTP
jgi:glycosyltransferase involved in cell wall biosynthesis